MRTHIFRGERRFWAGLAIVTIAVACGASMKQEGIEKVLGAMSADQRRSSFQDTATVLDQHPDWVDQFYEVAKTHPAVMKRFLTHAAHDLKDPEMAKTTGELLAGEPESLEQVLLRTIDAAKSKKDARLAIDRAVAARADAMADIMTDSPAAVAAMVKGLVTIAERKPAAKECLRKAIDQEAPRIVQFAASDPELMSSMTRSVLKAAAQDKDSLTKLLKDLHVI